MPHNYTNGIFDLIKGIEGLGKNKVSALASGIVGIMDNENELRNIVVDQVMRDALVDMLFRENAPGNIVGIVLTSSTEAMQLVKQLGEADISRELLDKIMNIVFNKPSINTTQINSVLEDVGIDVSKVSAIREVAVAPTSDDIVFSAVLVIEGISYDELSEQQKNTLENSILDSYVESLNLDLEKVSITVELIDSNATTNREGRAVNRNLLSREGEGSDKGNISATITVTTKQDNNETIFSFPQEDGGVKEIGVAVEEITLNIYQQFGDISAIDVRETLTKVVVHPIVKSIGYDAFRNYKALATITFGDSSKLKTIGASAFLDCEALTTISIPNSVTSIGEFAFQGCKALATITFGDSSALKTIGAGAFLDCEALTTIIIPKSVETIGYYAFGECKALATITFGD